MPGDKLPEWFSGQTRNPPFDKGLELKQCGVHLIFEGDDDYDGGQESLDKLKTYNLSQKNWPTFSAIYESGSPIYATDDEDE
ncbi:hypothetical protein JHK84_050099 [Glycine max]|nr:hypothetical protein JHK85_050826 [Glycine max]KAG5094511.1 hypothetical protein JHK84_050099 [Glycine max]